MNFFAKFFLPLVTSVFAIARSNSYEATELRSWYLNDKNALVYNDLDGVGKTSFWIRLDDEQIVLASFTWPVRPHGKVRQEKVVLISNGKIQNLQANLNCDSTSLNGEISTAEKIFPLHLNRKSIRVINTFSNFTHDLKPLQTLIKGSPITLVTL